jgi:hypothetical protein
MVKILLQAPPQNLRNLKRKFNYEISYMFYTNKSKSSQETNFNLIKSIQ